MEKAATAAVGKGRCAATEILVGTDAVANLIREGKCYQIPSILQSGAALGMHSLNADLARLVSTGRITREAAERCATNKSDVRVEEWRYLHAAALHETGREEIQ